MTGIYKITSPSGRIYIGQSVDIENRWKYYKHINSIKCQLKLYNSLKKYGYENHKFEVLEECSKEQLNEREIYWGLHFNTINEGLNHKLGNQNSIISEETKIKMSKKIYQYDLEGNFIKEWKSVNEASLELNMSKGWLSHIVNHPTMTLKNFRFTDTKVLKLNPITKNFKSKKPVLQYSLEGDLIKEWGSAKEAATYLNIFIQNITACCRGEIQTCCNFIWKYKCI